MARRRTTQLPLPMRPLARDGTRRGGPREGAGRKRAGKRPCVGHVARPGHDGRHPVHITLRVHRKAGFLRKECILRAIVGRLRLASDHFRVVQYSVQADHLHLLVEAESALWLTRKMTGLTTWLARTVNALLGRRGPFFADRYHRRDLRTPREVRHALLYVLQNRRKHEHRRTAETLAGFDPYSSAPWSANVFQEDAVAALGRARREAERVLGLARGSPSPLEAPTTWLASIGWLRARGGRLGLDEMPAV